MRRKVLILGDAHYPFIHEASQKRSLDLISREKPKIVIQIGDLYDFYSSASFPRSHNIFTPKEELETAHAQAENLWKEVRKRVPGAKCFQLIGNHDVRPRKRVMEMLPIVEHFLDTRSVFHFKGVETLFDDRSDLEIDGVIYEHGFYGKPGQHMRENMKPTVLGHTHRGWVHFESIRRDTLWELNVGYLADPASPGLSYPRKRWVKWTQGVGIVDDQGPRFIPFVGRGFNSFGIISPQDVAA